MSASGAARDVMFLVAGGVLVPLVLGLAASAAAATWVRRRVFTDRGWFLLFCAIGSVAVVLTVTLLRDAVLLAVTLLSDGLPQGAGLAGLLAWSEDGWERLTYRTFSSSQILLNAVLFAPSGAAWTVLTRRPVGVVVALCCLSLLVECLQGVTGLGAPDVADVVANTAGAAAGALAATLVAWVLPGTRAGRREVTRTLGTILALAVVTGTAVLVGAERRQASLEQELAERFAGTDLQQIHRWDAEERMHEEVFAPVSVFADGTRWGDDVVSVRYPASFFGARRCVFVEWVPAGVEIRPDGGARCSSFMS